MKKKEWTIEKEEELLSFLIDYCSGNRKKAKALLSNQCIKINNKIITKFNYLLKKGQTITITTMEDHQYHFEKELKILYEDPYLIAVNKKAGLLTMATAKETNNTLYHMVSDYVKAEKKTNKLFIVHRLDQETSGVLLFAKEEKAKQILQENWQELAIKRGYVAVVEGKLSQPTGTLKHYLKENKNLKMIASKNQEDGILAITHYQKIKQNDQFSLVEIQLETGRKNQIRAQFSKIGSPVVGDKKYGAKTDPLKRLCLHATEFVFLHPITKEKIALTSPFPQQFKELFSEKQ